MDTIDEYNRIFRSGLPEVEKVARAYDLITGSYLAEAKNEIELLKAMGDRAALIKEQIKLSTLEHARSIFADCYQRATGRTAWDE